MKKSTPIALCGTLAALSIVTMFLTALLPLLSLTLCAVAGMFLTVIVIEFSSRYAVTSYVVVVLLSGLFVADKESVVLFCLFFGLYPILKGLIEKLRNRPLEWVIKIVFFNAATIGCFFLVTAVLGIPTEIFAFIGEMAPVALLALTNVFFVVYDIAYTRLITLYLFRLQPGLHKRLGL